jgi:hypothetical protein
VRGVHGPGQEPWEVYVVKADADTLGKSDNGLADAAGCVCGVPDNTEGVTAAAGSDGRSGCC